MKKIILLFGLSLFVVSAQVRIPGPGGVSANITPDTITFDAASIQTTSTASWSHTIGSGTDLALLVWIATSPSTDTVSAVTFNGVGMTRVADYNGTGQPSLRIYLYFLASPAIGTHNITITTTAGGFVSGGASYAGVHQAIPTITATSDNLVVPGFTDAPTTLTTLVNNSWTAMMSTDTANAMMFAGTGTTARETTNQFISFFDSNAPITPAGSSTLNVQAGGTDSFTALMVALSPGP